MSIIEFYSDITGALEQARGSDGRLNTSSRSDSRGYYNARDQKQSYTLVYEHPASANSEYSFYWKNTSPTKELVISSVGINSDLGASVKLWFVSGTAGDGVAATPTNTNKGTTNDAASTSLEDGGGTPISSLTQAGVIDYVNISIDGHEELRLGDRVRLGQNDAIALQVIAAKSGTPRIFGVVFGFFEDKQN